MTNTVEIIINAKDQTGGALKSVRGNLGGLSDSFKRLGKVALGGAAVAGAALTGLGVGLGKLVTDSTMAAASVSEMNAVLHMLGERAGWSSAEVEDNIQSMIDLGIRSDVANKVLAQFARQQLDVADATMAARTAQDLAVLSQRDSSETLDELIYFVQTQNSSLQVARDLGIQAGDAMASYAEELGVTVEELDQAQRQQAILNAVQEAGVKVAGAYETAMEEPGKALRSLSRHFFEARVAIGEAFLPAFGNVIDMVTVGIKSIRGLLEETEPLGRIFGALGAIAASVTEALFGMAGSGDGLYLMLERIAEITEEVSSYIQFFLWRLEDGKGIIDSLIVTLNLLGLEGLATVIEKVREAIGVIQELLEPVIAWINKNVELQDVLLALGAAIASVIIPVLISIVTTIAPVIAIFLVAVATVAALRKAWETNFLGIRDITQAVIGFISGFIQGALAAIQSFWASHGDAIQAKAQSIWSSIQALISAVMGVIQGVVSTVTSAIQSLWANHGEALMTAATNTWEMIKSVISTVADVIQHTIDAFTAAITGDWEGFSEHLQAVWEGLWSIVLTIVGTAIQNIQTTFRSVDWGAVGRAVINGIANGIRAGAQRVADAAKGAAMSAFNAAKNILGIGSPSKLFEGIGENLMQGMALGIEGASGLPARAMAGAASRTVNTTNNYTINARYNYQDEVSLRDDVRFLQFAGS